MSSQSSQRFSCVPSLRGTDSLRAAAVKVAAEPRRSETLTARTAGKESRKEGRSTGMVKKIRATEPVEEFFRGHDLQHPGKIVPRAAPTRNPEARQGLKHCRFPKTRIVCRDIEIGFAKRVRR